MATWRELEKYVRGKYIVKEGPGGTLALDFKLQNRSQVIFVGIAGNDDLGEWAKVMSPIGPTEALDLSAVCQEAFGLVVGGVTVIGGVVMLSHSIPLADLDVDEFEVPLHMVCITADAFEAKFLGGDYA